VNVEVTRSLWKSRVVSPGRDIDRSCRRYRHVRQAGLDPEKAPASWAEIEAAAGAVDALGGDINGFYFAGACGGCNAFTFLPLVWASGGDIFAEGGAKVTLDTPQMHDAVNFYRSMIEKGYVPESAETDNGTNWLTSFTSGNIGVSQSGAFAIGTLNREYPDLDYGVTFLPGKDRSWTSATRPRPWIVRFGSGHRTVLRQLGRRPATPASAGTSLPRPRRVRHAFPQ
jgi:multiple sugar transport system substrate-binding protein